MHAAYKTRFPGWIFRDVTDGTGSRLSLQGRQCKNRQFYSNDFNLKQPAYKFRFPEGGYPPDIRPPEIGFCPQGSRRDPLQPFKNPTLHYTKNP